MNCWEFKKCGREKSCPAYPDHGRQCAQMARALCGGKVRGIFAIKLAGCLQCGFYQSEYYERTFAKPYERTRPDNRLSL
ncbi:MAG: hypothetical protein A2Y80_00410 [Deltaproteobacteria bacterium RBG_13_58_19]|nr:MAG: hypothetical protein A2Y80_00410 [Deltaproteobacteria bacterium RBG_13_58_19]